MGAELGQRREWNFEGELDWDLLEHAPHLGVHQWVRDLNHLYKDNPASYQLDNTHEGFQWMECDDRDTSIFSFVRYASEPRSALLYVCNFTPVPRESHRIPLPWLGTWSQVLNSDDTKYGGSGLGLGQKVKAEDTSFRHQPYSAEFLIPPLSVMVFRGPKAPKPVKAKDEREVVL